MACTMITPCLVVLCIVASAFTSAAAPENASTCEASGTCASSRGHALLQLSQKRVGVAVNALKQYDSFEDARPGTCCSIDAHTHMDWSMFKTTSAVAASISQGEPVVVPCGHEVIMDESVSGIRGLQVEGSVTFRDGVDIKLETGYVFVCGRFGIGSEASKHESRVEIVLTGDTDEDATWETPHGVKNFGKAPFVVYGGALYIRGSVCGSSPWARLQTTLRPKISLAQVRRVSEMRAIMHTDPQTNIAQGQPAVQSSTGHHRYIAGKAVDGSLNWKYGTALTAREENPWLYVSIDLLLSVGAGKVVLFTRSRWGADLSEAVVGVADSPCQKGQLCAGTRCQWVQEHMTNPRSNEFDCHGARGSFLFVQLAGLNTLTLAEAQVYPGLGDSDEQPTDDEPEDEFPEDDREEPEAEDEEENPDEEDGEELEGEEVEPEEEPEAEAELRTEPTDKPDDQTEGPEPDVPPGIFYDTNIAVGGSAVQSSTGHHRYTAEQAVDGIRGQWKCCTALTGKENNPWWYATIDLLPTLGAEKVSLWTRVRYGADLSVAVVGVTDTPCQLGQPCAGTMCAHVRSDGFANEFNCGGAKGKYLFVQILGEAELTLAEVEVFPAVFITANPTYELDVEVAADVAWKIGDSLLITPTGNNAGESDVLVIVGISGGGRYIVEGRMRYEHLGCDTASPECVMAAEVASLSRNVVIRGREGCDPVCGHFMHAHTNHGFVCGVEFTNLGQTAKEGRYPLHIHIPGDSPELVVKNNALHHNINRGLVMHGVNKMTTEANLCYKTKGHCFMGEDGSEQYNHILRNLGVDVSSLSFGCSHTHDPTFTCPDRSDGGPNAFWIANPNNYFDSNIGVAFGEAFRFETRHVTGKVRREFHAEAMKVGSGGKLKGTTALGQFTNNAAHSCGGGIGNYPRIGFKGAGRNAYENFTAWRCYRGMSAHTGGSRVLMAGNLLVENVIGIRGALPVSKVAIETTRIIADPHWTTTNKGTRYVSAPIFVHRMGTSKEAAIKSVFNIDNYTRNWVRCHGGFDADALNFSGGRGNWFSPFTDPAFVGACPTKFPQ